MAAVQKVLHTIEFSGGGQLTGSKKIVVGVMLPDAYSSIGNTVGIKKAGGNANIDFKATPGFLIDIGKAARLRIRTANKKSHLILCSMDKIKDAPVELVKKKLKYKNSEIKSAKIPGKFEVK